MLQRQQHWIDHTGLNLIRIVIGSYFMAISLGLISGIAPPALFLSVTDPKTADLIGTVLLFTITASFMLGLYLRMTSLILAIFVLSSSFVQNFLLAEVAQIGPFWRDLTLVCAILLSYTCLKRTELSRAALVWRRSTPRLKSNQAVIPRRITPGLGNTNRGSQTPAHNALLKPLMKRGTPAASALSDAETLVAEKSPQASSRPRLVEQRQPDKVEREVENIFAAL